jgi:hypothetical protein
LKEELRPKYQKAVLPFDISLPTYIFGSVISSLTIGFLIRCLEISEFEIENPASMAFALDWSVVKKLDLIEVNLLYKEVKEIYFFSLK